MSDDGSSLCLKRYMIARELFEQGFPGGDYGPCRCASTCCEGGVYADVTGRDRILAHRGLMTPHMVATQTLDATLWFEDKESLDRLGRCSLQVAATAAGMHKWALKPLHCVLYPLGIAGRVVSYDDMLQGEQECCSVEAPFDVPVFRTCKEELTHHLHEDGFRMLEQHYECLQRSRLPSVTCRQG